MLKAASLLVACKDLHLSDSNFEILLFIEFSSS